MNDDYREQMIMQLGRYKVLIYYFKSKNVMPYYYHVYFKILSNTFSIHFLLVQCVIIQYLVKLSS